MPELPEVETVRRGLAQHLVGRTITEVSVGRLRTVRRTSAEQLRNGLTGATVVAADRRGKYLVNPLDTGEAMMVHLRMSGQLLLVGAGGPRPLHTHVVLELSDGNELLFVDPRTFGEVVVFDPDHLATELPELAALGVDPLVDGVDGPTLRRLFGSRPTRLKAMLLDQHLVAGIGNIYADEILHASRIHPETPGRLLRRGDFERLAANTTTILVDAIRAGGSTLGDRQYVDLMGSDGWYQDEHAVYGRAGERCLTCGRGIVRRIVHAGRSTHFCPTCQRPRAPRPHPSSRESASPSAGRAPGSVGATSPPARPGEPLPCS